MEKSGRIAAGRLRETMTTLATGALFLLPPPVQDPAKIAGWIERGEVAELVRVARETPEHLEGIEDPLILVAGRGLLPVVEALLASGMDPNQERTVSSLDVEVKQTAVSAALDQGYLDVAELLTTRGARPEGCGWIGFPPHPVPTTGRRPNRGQPFRRSPGDTRLRRRQACSHRPSLSQSRRQPAPWWWTLPRQGTRTPTS